MGVWSRSRDIILCVMCASIISAIQDWRIKRTPSLGQRLPMHDLVPSTLLCDLFTCLKHVFCVMHSQIYLSEGWWPCRCDHTGLHHTMTVYISPIYVLHRGDAKLLILLFNGYSEPVPGLSHHDDWAQSSGFFHGDVSSCLPSKNCSSFQKSTENQKSDGDCC